MDDVLGQAMVDYYSNKKVAKLWIHNKYGEKEEMPVNVYFRDKETMPDLELIALQNCNGKVLEIGAGAGSHALALQDKGLDITALELSAGAVEVMQQRGVQKVIQEDIFNYAGDRFDTLLLLMNGIGLTRTIEGLKRFLAQAKALLNPGGQLIFDSSDVAYLYDSLPIEKYYGEIDYQYEYRKTKTDWFRWLYVDQEILVTIANEQGYRVELLTVDIYDQYLVKLTQ
jgi:SAM-dependent methyltransferase